MSEIDESKWVTRVGWSDIPHLTEESKSELMRSTPPYLRGARMRGEPTLGRGRVYTVDYDAIKVGGFRIPDHWPRCYGLDVGWRWTAAVWLAFNRDEEVIYVYGEYKASRKPPSTHAAAIDQRGDWIPGVIDPSARQHTADGKQVMQTYRELGLRIWEADNAVEAGILEIQQLLETGSLRVFNTLTDLRFEYNTYRRDDKGKIVKENDHLLDALRYAVSSGGQYAAARGAPGAGMSGWRQSSALDDRVGY